MGATVSVRVDYRSLAPAPLPNLLRWFSIKGALTSRDTNDASDSVTYPKLLN